MFFFFGACFVIHIWMWTSRSLFLWLLVLFNLWFYRSEKIEGEFSSMEARATNLVEFLYNWSLPIGPDPAILEETKSPFVKMFFIFIFIITEPKMAWTLSCLVTCCWYPSLNVPWLVNFIILNLQTLILFYPYSHLSKFQIMVGFIAWGWGLGLILGLVFELRASLLIYLDLGQI